MTLPQPSPPPKRIVPSRNWAARILAAVLILCVVGFAALVVTGGGVQWSQIPPYLLEPTILAGVRLTLLFTALAMLASLVGGMILAMLRLSDNPVLRGLSSLYIWFFRGTPLLVQIIFWFNIQLFIPRLAVGSLHVEMNDIVSPFTAALLALSLNESAYMAEIIRGGLLSVDSGQSEAATALGFTSGQSLRRIVLPQALRVTIPPIGNQTISMLKTTSRVSVVAAQDLLTRVQNIYARNFLIIELLIVASLWYLLLTSLATLAQHLIERRLSRGHAEVGRGEWTAPAEAPAPLIHGETNG